MIENVVISSDVSAPEPAKPSNKSRPRILIVDDSGSLREQKINLLSKFGYEVEGVGDGAHGWAALQVRHYDLVITDNTMPRMTGVEMIEKLRAAAMKIPVIMATGFMPIFEFARKPWLKPDVALAIPFSNDQLLQAVKELLR
jgi:CheY-like chemotaxis protein